MAIDWKKLTDPKRQAEFDKAGPDPRAAEKARAKFVKGLDTALAQFSNPEPSKGKKVWSVNNGVVKHEFHVGRSPITINGIAAVYPSPDEYEQEIGAFKAAALAGEFDDDLLAAVAPSGETKAKSGEKRTRNLSPESKLNIRVGGFRRGGKTDAEITKLLKAEGVAEADIQKAVARKPAVK